MTPPPNTPQPRRTLKIKATVAQNDAYDAVAALGKLAVANKIEQSIYASENWEDLLADLHHLVASVHREVDAR